MRDRIKILERDFKKKERFGKNASGISAKKTEMDEIMESYLEQRDDQEKESEKATEESRDKAAKDKASAEDARNKAMEHLSETRKRAASDVPRKKRKSTNETLEYLREASDKECELKKQELDLKQKQEENSFSTIPDASTNEESARAISSNVSNVCATTTNSKSGSA